MTIEVSMNIWKVHSSSKKLDSFKQIDIHLYLFTILMILRVYLLYIIRSEGRKGGTYFIVFCVVFSAFLNLLCCICQKLHYFYIFEY